MITDISKRRQWEKAELYQRMLLNDGDQCFKYPVDRAGFSEALQKHWKRWGQRLQSIASIFLKPTSAGTREPAMSRLFEWVREPAYTQIENPDGKICFITIVWARWYQTFNENRVISGLTKDFPAPEQEFLTSQGIVSTLLVPIIMNEQLCAYGL